MAVKKATTKKVAKKAPAKKVAAKKAVAKKAPAKKVAAKKAVAKKAPAKKAPAKKVAAKKAVAKKAPAKKAPARLTVGTFDAVPEVPFAERVSRPTPSLPSKSNAFQDRTVDLPVNTVEKKRSKTPAALAFLVLVGLASYVLINANSTDSSSEPTVAASPMETSAPEVSASPITTPTPEVTEEPSTPPAAVVAGDLSTSFIYTSTGIRLEWKINGAVASTITVSKSQDGGDYRTLSTLTGDARTLDITKTDTKGWTRFRVTAVTDNGDSLSSTVGLRGKFTL